MSVVSCRDPAMTRPASRRSSDTRPIFLLERCLAVRFERVEPNKAPPPQPPPPPTSTAARLGASLSHLSTCWLPWQRSQAHGRSASRASSDADGDAPATVPATPATPTAPSVPLVVQQTAPQGWIYDGGFVLFQVQLNCRLIVSKPIVDAI